MRIEPMSNMRQKIAEHMVFSKRTSAHVTTVHKADMTKVAKLRDKLKVQFESQYGFGLTYLPFVMRAAAAALPAAGELLGREAGAAGREPLFPPVLTEEGRPMSTEPTHFEKAAAERPGGNVLREFWDFLRHNKKWWLLPLLGLMAVFALLLILGGTGAAPFIYTLF